MKCVVGFVRRLEDCRNWFRKSFSSGGNSDGSARYRKQLEKEKMRGEEGGRRRKRWGDRDVGGGGRGGGNSVGGDTGMDGKWRAMTPRTRTEEGLQIYGIYKERISRF